MPFSKVLLQSTLPHRLILTELGTTWLYQTSEVQNVNVCETSALFLTSKIIEIRVKWSWKSYSSFYWTMFFRRASQDNIEAPIVVIRLKSWTNQQPNFFQNPTCWNIWDVGPSAWLVNTYNMFYYRRKQTLKKCPITCKTAEPKVGRQMYNVIFRKNASVNTLNDELRV